MTNLQQQFIADIYPGAKKLSDQSGSSLELILAQTALETGWGQHVLPGTNNLYNIKADAGWHGKTAEFTVPEVDDSGNTYMSKEKFRVYDSYEQSMADRARFLEANPRYAKSGLYDPGVKGDLEKEAAALQKTGYATDRRYAEKLISTGRGPTLQAGIDLAEGREVRSPDTHHAGTLRRRDHGEAVAGLQASLVDLGYVGQDGKPLKVDQDLGPNTIHALKAFQHDHGLSVDGVAGDKTFAALSEAISSKHQTRTEAFSMLRADHPAHGMYEQAFRCVAQLDAERQREPGPHSQMLSGSLVSAAASAGFQRIDHVVLSDDASRAYAVQGDLGSPFKKYVDVNVVQAIHTPIAQSSVEAMGYLESIQQANIERDRQTQAAAMQQSQQEVQGQHPAMQR